MHRMIDQTWGQTSLFELCPPRSDSSQLRDLLKTPHNLSGITTGTERKQRGLSPGKSGLKFPMDWIEEKD